MTKEIVPSQNVLKYRALKQKADNEAYYRKAYVEFLNNAIVDAMMCGKTQLKIGVEHSNLVYEKEGVILGRPVCSHVAPELWMQILNELEAPIHYERIYYRLWIWTLQDTFIIRWQ